ncbi:hypothetical protein DUNSADRAFT_12852 [Dunaliella salina]|uniref:Encoded protein n=1 Tax=Dunaliella salina TaxID=3046 RepID=A0ABQ7H9R3_DUNSA|nr:hypothetical protein DUNSADRAFT_12852 [Dunaliella salina]|eukprot:KAF5843590.1 hypothetical protein DUNSADRAFT_12852 [Dunaliella salina]
MGEFIKGHDVSGQCAWPNQCSSVQGNQKWRCSSAQTELRREEKIKYETDHKTNHIETPCLEQSIRVFACEFMVLVAVQN